MFDNGWDKVVDGIAALTGCDRDALAALLGQPADPDALDQAVLLDRIGAAERLAQAVQAVQVHDLAAFNAALPGSAGDKAPLDAARDPQLPAAARMAVVEVACELQVAQVTAGCRITDRDPGRRTITPTCWTWSAPAGCRWPGSAGYSTRP